MRTWLCSIMCTQVLSHLFTVLVWSWRFGKNFIIVDIWSLHCFKEKNLKRKRIDYLCAFFYTLDYDICCSTQNKRQFYSTVYNFSLYYFLCKSLFLRFVHQIKPLFLLLERILPNYSHRRIVKGQSETHLSLLLNHDVFCFVHSLYVYIEYILSFVILKTFFSSFFLSLFFYIMYYF